MRKIITIAAITMAATSLAFAQGTVSFRTSVLGVEAKVLESVGFPGAGTGLGNTAAGGAAGSQFLMQLYAAAGSVTDSSLLVPVGMPVNSRNGSSNGGYVQETGTTTLGAAVNTIVTIPFVSPKGPVTLQLRAWWAGSSGNTYTTYEAALGSGNSQMRFGASPLIQLQTTGDNGSPPTTPAVLNGLRGFQLSPWFTSTPPLISPQPQSQNIAYGSNVTFSVGVFGAYPVAYQWRKDGWIVNNATQSSYTITAATYLDIGGYDVIATNYYGSTTSAVAQLMVGNPPVINQQPVGATVASGQNVALSVGADGDAPLSYLWRKDGVAVPNATNALLELNPALTNLAGQYRVVVSNPGGAVTSSVAIVTVYIPVEISSHPAAQIASLRGTALFSGAASGYPAPNYQWTFNGGFVPGATQNNLTITNVGLGALGGYALIAWNSYSVTTSAVAQLLMSPSLSSPFVGTTAIWGKEAALSVSAVGSGSLSYQWLKDGAVISGATGSSLQFPSVQIGDGGMYSVVVTSAWGSVTNTPALLVVNPANISLGLYAGVKIDGVPGYTYAIQYSTNLTDTNAWVLATNYTLAQPIEIWFDPSVDVHSPTTKQRFYRVMAP